jgi:hypothetical protein
MAAALRRLLDRAEKGESGQALIIVMIAILLLVLIAPIVVSQSVGEDNSVAVAANFEAALSAAEAGVQQYQNYLDEISDYWKYNSTGVPPDPISDPALAAGGWSIIPGSKPTESFHYFPNTTFLSKGVSAGTAEVLLTVTGRAGATGHYVYRTVQVTLASKGLLSNAYFSQYETEDWQQDTAPVTVTTVSTVTGCTVTKNSATVGGNLTTCNLSGVVPLDTVTGTNIPGTTTVLAESTTGTTTSMTLSNNASGSSAPTESLTIGTPVNYSVGPPTAASNGAPEMVTGQTFWQSLCQYETYQPNTFIDSLGSLTPSQGIPNPFIAGDPDYSATYPYYGPYRGADPTNDPVGGPVFTYAYSSTESASVTDACGPIFNFVSGESLTGPVYTNDQLWVCGSPSFSSGLTSGIPVGFNFAYPTWPGNEAGAVGTNGWIDDLSLDWDNSCGGTPPSHPSFGTNGIIDGGTDILPPVDTSLSTAASSSGCLYSGPTMVEFVAGGTFNIWSPYSSGANAPSNASQCGTFSAAAPMVTGLTVPAAGLVIYVQSVPSATPAVPLIAPSALGDGTNGGLPSGATCSNPWKPYAPASICATVGEEGDAVVDGELQGEVTLGTSNSIVISRDLTYECADANSVPAGVTAQESSLYVLPAACASEANPDVLGLAATSDVVISKPQQGVTPPTNGYTYVQPVSGNFTLSCNGTATGSIAYNAPPTGFGSVQTALDAVAACSSPVVTNPAGAGYLITLPQTVVLTGSTGNMSSPANSDDNVPTQTEPYAWPAPASPASGWCTTDGTEASQPSTPAGLATNIADIVPDCMIQNPVIDAAIVSVQGSLADEDWDIGPNNAGGAYLQGTDVSFMRGPFGLGGTSGYDKEFSYDSRLTYLTPPSMIDIADLTWGSNSFVNCGSINDGTTTLPANVCPGLDWLNGG